MSRDAHTDARTHGRTGQKHYVYGHTTFGGGIKRNKYKLKTKLEKVALDGNVECCATPPRPRDLEL